MIFNLGWSFDTFSPVTFDMDWSRKFILPASIIQGANAPRKCDGVKLFCPVMK